MGQLGSNLQPHQSPDFPMSGEVGRDRAVTFGGTMRSTAGYTRSTSGNRFGFWMAFKVSLAMLRTPKGLFKILEFVLVLTCILIARFGGGDFPMRGECPGKAITNDTGKA